MPQPAPQPLRFDSHPGTEVSTFVAASPAAVFAAVSDINLPAKFGTEFKGGRWLDGATGPAVGARFTGRNAHPAVGEWETTCTVTAYDPPRLFEYEVTGADGTTGSSWRFTVTPAGPGCELTQSMRMGPGRSLINRAIDAMPDKESKILHRRLKEHRTNMQANLEGIKNMLELTPPARPGPSAAAWM